MTQPRTRSLDRFRLDGLIALITGAGRGLGEACAIALADAGAEVILMSRTESELDDILVNNAGTNIPEPFLEVSLDHLDTILNLNLRGAFLMAQGVARGMVTRGQGGSIIHMSSQMGHVGAPNRTAYCASKHAIEGLTKAMGVELAPHRIRTNSVGPTFVDTPLAKKFLDDPAFSKDVLERIPMGKLGQVEDVADAVVYLAAPASNMVTGTSLLVDGGWTAR
jgi:NAD(P)-dependent dehydrogenase (short-subunit alcohol dehydrogenase family)